MRDAERLLSLGECRSYFFLKHQRSFGTEFSSFYSVCLTHFIFFSFFYFYYYYFGPAMRHVESSFLGQGLNSHYLHWKHRVPTTGPLGKSQTLIFRAVLGSQKNWAECTKGSHISLAFIHALPLSTSCLRVAHLLQYKNLNWLIPVTPNSYFTFTFTLGVYSMDFDKCIRTCIHHYSTMQKISLPKISYVFCLLTALNPHPLATTELFTVCIVLPFPECYVFGIIEYVAFSDCLLSLVICF